jgi:beta-glucosidase
MTSDHQSRALPVELRVEHLLSQMTLSEKVAQLTCLYARGITEGTSAERIARLQPHAAQGAGMIAMPSAWADDPRSNSENCNAIQRMFCEQGRLGIPVIIHEEGLHGYVAAGATSFPAPPALASTYNPDLVRRAFEIAGRETRLCGGNLVFTPMLDLAREPRWGRTEESYGEDPWLVAEMGVACVTGYQGDTAPIIDLRHVGATVKHYTGHGSPEAGINLGPTQADARTIADVCQVPFKACVQRGKALAVMATYSEIDGVPLHTSRHYLTHVLREQWGFLGLVVSDWYGVKMALELHRVAHDAQEVAILALEAGLDLETPDLLVFPTLEAAVIEGKVAMASIDRAVRRVLRLKFLMGLFDDPYTDPEEAARVVGNQEAREVARQVAEEAITLLKNDGGLLPLDRGRLGTLAVIGPHAQGVELGNYSGRPLQRVSVLDGLRAKLGTEVRIVTAEGVRLLDPEIPGDRDPIRLADPETNRARIAEAVAVARDADVILLCLGGNRYLTREAWAPDHLGDNASLELRSQQNDLVAAMLATGKPVVVALFHGAPLAFEQIARDVPAILECWVLGQEAGAALANVVLGDVNPSGKLPVTLARSAGQLPVFYNHKPSARSRGYVVDEARPLYPFGFGLSYTTFAYGPPRIDVGPTPILSVDVTNTGSRFGKETVQLYVRDQVASVTRPVKELRGFQKVGIEPGATRTVRFQITPELLAFHDLRMDWVVEAGAFDLMVGGSSEDLQTVTLQVDRKLVLPERGDP